MLFIVELDVSKTLFFLVTQVCNKLSSDGQREDTYTALDINYMLFVSLLLNASSLRH